MEDNEQRPAPITEASTPQVVERPLWVLSRDEQRVLVITFVGGLASIVIGACVIGGAIALVRSVKVTHFLLGFLAISTAVDIWILVWVVNTHRRRGGPWSSGELAVWPLFCFTFAVLLLAWIGLAAGIH